MVIAAARSDGWHFIQTVCIWGIVATLTLSIPALRASVRHRMNYQRPLRPLPPDTRHRRHQR